MRILLLGEYSNVHWTLAEGLRALGHEVCVVSNGDYWKDYRRDVSLVRRSYGRWDSLVYMAQVWKALTDESQARFLRMTVQRPLASRWCCINQPQP